MTNVPCPRCGMLVGLEEVICPHCRAPRDDMEMEEGRALVNKEEARLKRRPLIIAARVIAGILLASAWLLRGFVTAPMGAAWREFRAEVEKTRQPSHWNKGNIAEPIAETIAAPIPPPEVGVSSFVYINPRAPEAADAAQPPAARPPVRVSPAAMTLSPEPQPGELRVQGVVYDLATAMPVGDVTVRFRQLERGAKWEATTDAAGRYQMILNKDASGSITVMIEAPGYRSGLLEDRDPPYRERSAQSRADLIEETTDSDLEPVPLRYKESAQIVELDLVLIPQAKK